MCAERVQGRSQQVMVAVGLTVAVVRRVLLTGFCCCCLVVVAGCVLLSIVQVSSGKEKKVRAKERKEKTVLPAEFKVRVCGARF